MGDLAVDAEAGRGFPKAAIHGDKAGAARQHNRSKHLDRYTTALAAVQAGHGDGVTYVLTKQDGLAAIDLDHCRDVVTGSVDFWAQLMLEQALHSYAEITPSGTGLRIWGTAAGGALHRKFALDTGENAAVELFRATNKALTISGLDLRQGRKLGNIDSLMDWCVFFGEKHKPAPTAAAAPTHFNGGSGLPYSARSN